MGTSALLLYPLLLLLSLCVGPSLAQSTNALYWSFCYYGSDVGWSVTISGSFLSTPLHSPPWPGVPTYRILNALGTRIEYDASGNMVSFSNVIGIAPLNVTASQNNNNVQTQWPVLDSSGVAFLLDANVSVLGTSPGYNTSISAISGEPPVEFPVRVTTTTFSYFMYQTGNTATALQCPAPAPLQLVYYYTASDKHTQDPYSFALGKSVWSSCGTGIISLQGPYSFPSQYSLAGRTIYIAQAIVGERVFVNTSFSQRVNVSGVNTQDGGDFIFYTDAPFVDYAGITMGTDVEPAFATGSFSGFSYLNWWTPDGVTIYEAIQPNTADNVMQFSITPYVSGQTMPICDPHTIQSTIFYYCFYADVGDSEIRMTGSVVTNALNTTDGSYWVTGMDGLRVQVHATGGNITSTAYDMSFQQDAYGNHNNRLYQQHPFLDSTLGLTYQLRAAALDGEGRIARLSGSPPQESWSSVVNDTLHPAQSPFQSWLVYQNASAPACPLKRERASLLQEWAFRYTVTTPTQEWLIACTGTLTVLGPFQQSLRPSQTLYIVVNATGQRAYITAEGIQQLTVIAGLANATTTGASQMVYNVDGDDFTLDKSGLALRLDSEASWPTLPSSNILMLIGASAIQEKPYIASELELSVSVPPGAVTMQVDPDHSVWVNSPPFQLNDNAVNIVYYSQGMWVVAVLVLTFAMHAVFALQRAALQLQGRVAVSHHRLVASLVVLMSAVYGICGVWTAEIILFATLELDCPGCVYSYSLALMQSRVALAILPATLLALPSWALLCNTAVIVRIREASRSSQVHANRVEGTTSRMGSLLTAAVHSRRMISIGVGTPKLSLSTRAKDAVLRVAVLVTSMLVALRSSLGWLTFVIALPIAAGIVLTRSTLTTGLVAPVDVTPMVVANVLGAVLTVLLSWVMVTMHVSGKVWRYCASLGLPLVVLLDFHLDAVSRSVTWNSAAASVKSTALDDTSLWTIGGTLAVCSARIYVLSVADAVQRRRRLLEHEVHHAENKFQSTQRKLDVQSLRLRRLRTLHNESVRIHEIISLARPGMSEGLLWHCLLQTEPSLQLQLLEHSAASCTREFELQLPSAAGIIPSMRVSGIHPAANDLNMGMEKRLMAGSSTSSTSFGEVSEDDEIGQAVEEQMDDATQALVSLLQRAKRRALIRAATTTVNREKRQEDNHPLSASTAVGDSDDALCALPDTRSSVCQLLRGLPSQWIPPLSYQPGLQEILGHPVTIELLKDAMQTQNCVENVLFLCRVRRWMDPSTQRQHSIVRALLAEQITHDFIQNNAPYQINLDYSSRERLLRKVQEGQLPLMLFSPADGEVRRLIEVNNWPQFTQSSSYTFCIHVLWRNVAIMKAMQEQLVKGSAGKTDGRGEEIRGSRGETGKG